MPRLRYRLSSYRLHKGIGCAVVTLNGRDHYLGRFGSDTSRREYRRLIAEWAASHRQASRPAADKTPPDLTLNELFLAYWGVV